MVKSIRIIAVATGTEFLVVHSGGDSKDSVSTVMVTESGDPKRPAVRVTVLESRREYQLKVGQGLVAKKGEEPKIIENHGLDAVTGREAAKVFEAVRKARGLPSQIQAESDMPVQNPD